MSQNEQYDPKVLRKLQLAELEVFKDFIKICDENGLSYFLFAGCAIGVERHKGFIPWDDDIDIGMMRSDYDRFCSLAEGGLPEGYSLHTSRNTTGYAAMFAKVYRDGTRFENQEAREASSSMGIFVDIFPYDQLYTDKRLRAKQVRTASIAQKRAYLYHSSSIVVPHKGFLGQLEQIGCSAMHVVEQLVSRGACSYQDLFDSCIADSNTGEVSDYCLTLSWPNMAPVPISEIFPLSSAVFEGSEFPVPRMTDKYLTTMYGDWKKIPSPDNRHTHLPLLLDFGDGEVWTAQN